MANTDRQNSDVSKEIKAVGAAPVTRGDNFDKSYSAPEILNSNFGEMYQAKPFDSQPAALLNQDVSTVDPLAGIETVGFAPIQVQNIEADLIMLRAEMPFLPIMRFPRVVRTVFMAAASAPVDVNVPDGAALVSFSGPGDFYINMGGRAVIPSAASLPDDSSVYKPTGVLYYIGGTKQIGVVSAAINGIVTMSFIMRPSPSQGF